MGSERAAAPLGQPIIPFAVTILQASAKPLPLSGAVIRTINPGAPNVDFLSQRGDGQASIAKNRARRYSAVTLVVEASRAAFSEDHSVTELCNFGQKAVIQGRWR